MGDRGMLTEARIREEVHPARLDWISALWGPAIRTLLKDLATLSKNQAVPQIPGAEPFDVLTRPIELQAEAFRLLGVRIRWCFQYRTAGNRIV